MRPELRVGDLVRFTKGDVNSSDVLYRVVNWHSPRDRMSRRRMRNSTGPSTADGLCLISIRPVGTKRGRGNTLEVARRRLWKIPEAHQPRRKQAAKPAKLPDDRWLASGRW